MYKFRRRNSLSYRPQGPHQKRTIYLAGGVASWFFFLGSCTRNITISFTTVCTDVNWFFMCDLRKPLAKKVRGIWQLRFVHTGSSWSACFHPVTILDQCDGEFHYLFSNNDCMKLKTYKLVRIFISDKPFAMSRHPPCNTWFVDKESLWWHLSIVPQEHCFHSELGL